jgi:hypothetical protein
LHPPDHQIESIPIFQIFFAQRTTAKRKNLSVKYQLALLTAVKNRNAVRGMVAAKMPPVTNMPNSGAPEEISNTEPTAAIAEIDEPSKHKPVLGVYIIMRLV